LDIVLARARKEYVHQLMVDGKIIVDQGVLRSLDLAAIEAELLAQARVAWPGAASSIGLRTRYRNALGDLYRCGHHRTAPTA
jgi:hypothetical protein